MKLVRPDRVALTYWTVVGAGADIELLFVGNDSASVVFAVWEWNDPAATGHIMLMPAASVSINFDAVDIDGGDFFPFALFAILLPATCRHRFRFPLSFSCTVAGMVTSAPVLDTQTINIRRGGAL